MREAHTRDAHKRRLIVFMAGADNFDAHYNLGVALMQGSNASDSSARIEELLQRALQIRPGAADAHAMLGFLLHQQQRREAAAFHYRASLSVKERADVRENLRRLGGDG